MPVEETQYTIIPNDDLSTLVAQNEMSAKSAYDFVQLFHRQDDDDDDDE